MRNTIVRAFFQFFLLSPLTFCIAIAKSNLPHSGLTPEQCATAGSFMLTSCSNAEAINLSGLGKQDGMRATINPMRYSKLSGFARTKCVRDKTTGLTWEGKAATGLRAGTNTYTNFGDGRVGDASEYVSRINAMALCGLTDWRLPSVDELQTIVDYSKRIPGPTIDTTWFPNSAGVGYWSSTSGTGAGELNRAWYINFIQGFDSRSDRTSSLRVRLVSGNL